MVEGDAGASAQTYFLYDGLGSTTDLVDGSGTTIASYQYDVFGAIRSQYGSSPNYWLFTGEQRDADSGLYYLRARGPERSGDPGVSEGPGRAGNAGVALGQVPPLRSG